MKLKIIILLIFIITFLFAKDQVTIYNEDFALVRSTIELELKKGIQSLSDAEIIAILIGSGTKNESAVEDRKSVV